MFLSQLNKASIYRRFPKVELSYENTVYKKVHNADLYLAIPSKNKYFAWFTYFQNKSVCFIINILNDRFSNIRAYPCCFDNCLSLGTVLYGSLFITPDKHTVFCAEDILQYKGRNIDKCDWNNRITYLEKFTHHIKPILFTKEFLLISTVLYSTNYKDLEVFIENSVYDVEYIQARNLNSQKFENFSINQIKRRERGALPTAIFLIKPCVQTEIYELHYFVNSLEFYNVAHIPDYKTSIFMNSIFRNIRENANLDAIEESDDEDDFENISEEKYVDLTKQKVMRCSYSYRFKRWVPLEIVDSKTKLTTYQELKLLEKKN
jgi:hypothetical protein